MNTSPVIELRGVCKSYGSRSVLNDTSLVIERGVTGLLGPNGSGKSTLIKSMMGLVKIDQGTGQILGREWPLLARDIRDLVGYLPEDDCYLAGLQGVESVQLAARLSGLESREALRRSHEVLDFCDVGQERYRQVETYSTGMRQKLKFAQSLVHDPSLIILDEPTTGLDPSQREAVLSRIRTLAKEHHKTILLSTHILPDVRQVCDSVAILALGQIRVSATLEQLSQPAQPGLSLTLQHGHDNFIDLLRAKGIVFTEHDRGEIQVQGLGSERSQILWDWAAECHAAISRLEPARASLEQIFMDVVRQTQSRQIETMPATDGRPQAGHPFQPNNGLEET